MVQISPYTHTKPLQQGDEVVTVAASSALDDDQELLEGLKILESWGLVCRPQFVTKNTWGYLAGDDSIRYQSLHPNDYAPLLAFERGVAWLNSIGDANPYWSITSK